MTTAFPLRDESPPPTKTTPYNMHEYMSRFFEMDPIQKRSFLSALLLALAFCLSDTQAAESVPVSARDVPVFAEVDVLVLGGSTGAVAAAETAAHGGAKTMLLTRYPYLGEDMTASLRLWRSEEAANGSIGAPLYDEMMKDPIYGTPETEIELLLRYPDKVPFRYELLQPVSRTHPETPKKNRLCDGKTFSAGKDSLQVDGNATVILDFGSVRNVGLVSVFSFYRQDRFALDHVTFSVSEDRTRWSPIGTVYRDMKAVPGSDTPETFTRKLDRPVKARYVKVETTLEESSDATLLGEIVVLPDGDAFDDFTAGARSRPVSRNLLPRPLHIKQVLDRTLLRAGVEFLFGVYVTGKIEDSAGRERGVFITSRAGRQVVKAKTVIDARYDYAGILETCSADENVRIQYAVIGGDPIPFEKEKYDLLRSGICEIEHPPFYAHWPNPSRTAGGEFPLLLYTFELKYDDAQKIFRGDLSALGRLVREIRTATFQGEQQAASDRIDLLPGSRPAENMPLGNRYGADAIEHGRRSGRLAANLAFQRHDEKRSASNGRSESRGTVSGTDVRELLQGMRPYEKPLGIVHEPGKTIPVAGRFDVIVVGGGTTGAPAAIAAARAGAKTLVIEYQQELGGIGTVGSIAGYYWGNRTGFTREISDGKKSWHPVQKAQHWLNELHRAGGQAWFGTLGAGALVASRTEPDGLDAVKGVLLATEFGPRIVLGDVIVDTTGNGDIARAAGAEMMFVTTGEITVQGAGLAPRLLGDRYMNNDFTYIDDTDPIDATHVYVYGKMKYENAFDLGKILNTRERRRIVGEFTLSVLDVINGRTYPDSIALAFSNFDTHGYTTTPYLEVRHPDKKGLYAYYPYRASLPKGLDGILVGALATSCHRDALSVIRMQADLQNQGYALGYAAAMASQAGLSPRQVDLRSIQRHLVEIGNLPEKVLEETDNYESAGNALVDAVRSIPDNYRGAELLMWHPEESIPPLRRAYGEATAFKDQYAYAKVLAALGDGTGEATLLEELKRHDRWDVGWNFKSMSQFGMASSPLDQTVMMLGRIRSRAAVPEIVRLFSLLKQEDDFSHHRACLLALEWIGDPDAIPALAAHLSKPEMSGYVHDSLDTARIRDQEDPKTGLGEKSRRDSLIEISTARALYRLGDDDDAGKQVLEKYLKDRRGHFARHAAEVLGFSEK